MIRDDIPSIWDHLAESERERERENQSSLKTLVSERWPPCGIIHLFAATLASPLVQLLAPSALSHERRENGRNETLLRVLL
jgi:hypothetical protein